MSTSSDNFEIELTDAPDEHNNECDSCLCYSSIKINFRGYSDGFDLLLCPECAMDVIEELSSLLNDKEKMMSKKNIYRDKQ